MTKENTIENIVKDINASIAGFKDDNKKLSDSLKSDVSANATAVKEVIATCEGLATKVQAHADTILELQQEAQEKVAKGKAPVQTLGQIVINSDAYKNFAGGKGQKARIEANTISGGSGSPIETDNTIVPADRVGMVGGAFRRLNILDLIPVGNTTSNAVEYTRESLFTNNAAETAEAETKPESVLTFELVNTPIRTIAHWIKVTKQVIEDAPMLQSYIDNRMRYGVELRRENQIIAGNGTAPNLSGIFDTGNHTAFTPTAGESAIDSVNRAIYATLGNDYAATGILLNPADWGAIERIKGQDGHYVFGNPAGGPTMAPVLWGLPVLASNGVAAGKFAVAAFNVAYMYWNRANAVVEMFEQDDTNVQQNLITVRAELRGALTSDRPASCYAGDLVSTATV